MKPDVRTIAALLAGCALLAACSGPPDSFDVGVREVATDIVLGAGGDETDVDPPEVPPTAVDVSVPEPVEVGEPPPPPPPPAPEPTPVGPAPAPAVTPEPEACPGPDPRDAPRADVRRDTITVPVERSYTFRNDGGYEVSGPDTDSGDFTRPTQRTVRDVEERSGGDVTYAVEAELNGTVTTTHYLVRNEPQLTDPTGATDHAGGHHDGRGLYIAGIDTERPDGETSSFRPLEPLLLLPLPVVEGDEFDVSGVDPVSGRTMSYHLRVEGTSRVEACEEPLAAVRVELSDGRISGPLIAVEFVATYDLGTQFGGLMLRDEFVVAGQEGARTVSRHNTATISDVPAEGRQPQ